MARTSIRTHVVLFALLAVASIGATWYYIMLSFFAFCVSSYGTVNLEKLELWLRDTELFKQTCETVVEMGHRVPSGLICRLGNHQ